MFSFFSKKKISGSQVNLKIEGMHCTSCSMNIDGSLEDEDGVLEASTSYAKSVTTVTYDPSKTSPEKIIKIIKQAGYNATVN